MPLIHLAKAVAGLGAGAVVEIVGDDPIFELGVREFCLARGFGVEKIRGDGRETHLEVRVARPGEGP
jgi:TusA-related sulfurtransferase